MMFCVISWCRWWRQGRGWITCSRRETCIGLIIFCQMNQDERKKTMQRCCNRSLSRWNHAVILHAGNLLITEVKGRDVKKQ